MPAFHDRTRRLVSSGEVRVSNHGYDELTQDNLSAREVVEGLAHATLIEEYPDFAKGHCALFLQMDSNGLPVHVVWGIPKDYDYPAVLVTAYRPDPKKWDRTFKMRVMS